MEEEKNLSQDLNSDLFWFGESTAEETPDVVEEGSLMGIPDPVVEEGGETVVEWEGSPDLGEELVPWGESSTGEEVIVDETTEWGKDELGSLLADLKWDNEEIDEKVEEIKEEVKDSGNTELIWTINDLQSMLAEKTTKVQELTKQLEVSNVSLMDKVWESEELSIYRPVIENLENNPKLMLLAKYWDSKWISNPKMKNRLIWIVSDLIMEYTWEDISTLINNKQADAIWDLEDLWWGAAPIPTAAPKWDVKDLSKEESLNNLF